MTAVQRDVAAPAPSAPLRVADVLRRSGPGGAGGAGSHPRSEPARLRRSDVAGLGLTVAGALLALFVLYLYVFSGLSGARNQATLLRAIDADQIATFALTDGRTPPPGRPVAVLDVPAIHLHQAVLVGTTAGDLQRGPGLVAGSVLPGRPGTAVIAGRRVSFGGPFARIGSLRPGDTVHVTDGIGTFTYAVTKVEAVTGPGPLVAGGPRDAGWLALVTASSGWLPTGDQVAFARLVGAPDGTDHGVLADPRLPMFGGDPAAGILAALWVLGMIAALAALVFGVRRWRQPRLAWVLASPVILTCGLLASESLARCLPSTL